MEVNEGAWGRRFFGRGLPRPIRAIGREDGQALVEFALILPVLALLLFGIVDFARVLNYYNNLTQLAGQGARAAAVYSNPNGSGSVTASSIQCQLIDTYTSSHELRKGIQVQFTQRPTQVGEPVEVSASYSFSFIPLVRSISLTISATSAHRAEVVPSTGFTPDALVHQDNAAGVCS